MSFSLSSILSPPGQRPDQQAPRFARNHNHIEQPTVDLTPRPALQRHRDDRFYHQSRTSQYSPHVETQSYPQHPSGRSASCLNSEFDHSPQMYHNSTSSEYGASSPLYLLPHTHPFPTNLETRSRPNSHHMNHQLRRSNPSPPSPIPHVNPTLDYDFSRHTASAFDALQDEDDNTPNISQEAFSTVDDADSETEAGSSAGETHEEFLRYLNAPVGTSPYLLDDNFGYGSPTLPDFLDLTDPSADSPHAISYPEVNHASNMPGQEARITRKRSIAEISDDAGPSARTSIARRRRASSSGRAHAVSDFRAPPPRTKSIEEIDLVAEEEEEANALAESRAKQCAEAVKAQQQHNTDDGKSKLSMLQCTVCLDVTEDLTATICGHTFCHSCLLNWLIAGEREAQRRPTCPACRKPLKRQSKSDVIVLEIMKKRRR